MMKDEIVQQLEEIDELTSSYIENIVQEVGETIVDRIREDIATTLGVQLVNEEGSVRSSKEVFEDICKAYSELTETKRETMKDKVTNFETKITQTKNTIKIKFSKKG